MGKCFRCLILQVAALAAAAAPAVADTVIDPFTAPQGPFTFGPGEEITQQQAILETESVLGGFRIAAAGIDEEAAPGSAVTIDIGDGEFLCDLSFSVVDEETSGGGCGVGYDRSIGPYFDLSQVTSFDLNVLEAAGSPALGIFAVDGDEDSAIASVELTSTGPLSIPRQMFFALAGQDFDWTRVDAIVFAVANTDGFDARVRLGGLSTTGPIQTGEVGPEPEPTLPDEALSDTVSGNYFNPVRDGEGCMLTREADAITFILTCYFYASGEQAWLIGIGILEDGQIAFEDMILTRGADYGQAFDPDAVERIPFGDVRMQFADCNEALITMEPIIDGFVPIELPMQRIIAVDCEQGVPSPANAGRAGNWFNPLRDGEGFQLAVEGDEDLHILTYYTYLEGQQVWMLGTGTLAGDVIEFADVHVTRGTGFGPLFDAEEVERTFFGTITMTFEDCNNAVVRAESILPQFPDLETEVIKIVPGPCEP